MVAMESIARLFKDGTRRMDLTHLDVDANKSRLIVLLKINGLQSCSAIIAVLMLN